MQERFDQFGPIKAKAKGKEKHLKYFCNSLTLLLVRIAMLK